MPLKPHSDLLDIPNPNTDSLKRKSEDIVVTNHSLVATKPQLIIKPQNIGMSNTIERNKEDFAEIKVNSSGDTNSKGADDSSSISGGSDPNEKDKFGATKALRQQIQQKYQILDVLGKGSYGCVSKAKCLKTGRIVALKIMENQTNTEYDTIKLLREI